MSIPELSIQQVEAFLNQPPPRVVPLHVRRAQLGYTAYVLYAMGMLALAAVVLLEMFLVQSDLGLIAAAAALSIVPFGLGCLLSTWCSRRRLVYVLKHGYCHQAAVTHVLQTRQSIKFQKQYAITFRYADHNGQRDVVARANEQAAARASRLQSSGEATRILVHPYGPWDEWRRENLRRALARKILSRPFAIIFLPRHAPTALWLYGMVAD